MVPQIGGPKIDTIMKRMRWLTMGAMGALAGVTAVCLVACSSGPRHAAVGSTVARWHFVGATQLQSQSTAPAVASLLKGTNSGPAGERLATNLVAALMQRLGRTDGARMKAALAPLMLDLMRHESAGDVATTGWRLKLKLPPERWSAWQNARTVLGELSGATTATVLTYTNGWMSASWGSLSVPDWLSLGNGVFAAEGDLTRIFDGTASANWPRVQFGATLEENTVISRASLDFQQPPLTPLPAWKLPERVAHAPFSQFTAVRGISQLAARIDWWREAFAGHPPDQMFWWSQPEVPFRNWMAVPSTDPTGDLDRLAAAAGKFFGQHGRSGRVAEATNHTAFAILDTLKGLEPVVTRVKQNADSFLLGSLYPAARSTNTMSDKLRRLLAAPDLVFQDAEFTPEAIDHWNVLFQLNQILQSNLPNARNARAHSWMFDNRTLLGDAETTIRVVQPKRLVFERKSSFGLTGIEFVMLTRWLDGGDYHPRRSQVPPTPTASPKPAKP